MFYQEVDSNLLSISSKEYILLKDLVYERFGINLGNKKQALVFGRLQKVLKQIGFTSFNQYYNYLLNDSTGEAMDTLINRISTNHTYFNREHDHFDFFFKIALPEVEQKKTTDDKHIRIWSAGCSSGEEAYTLACIMKEYRDQSNGKWKPAILATDISNSVLKKAVQGTYENENVSKLDIRLKNKYFKKNSLGKYQIDSKLKETILFRRLNLMRNEYPFKQKFDTIFCRNVMIYFDHKTCQDLINKFNRYLESGGYLIIGMSESLGRSNAHFEYIQPAVYRKRS